MVEKVKLFIEQECGIDACRPVLVALSGGADSVALLRVLIELGYDCRAAHCNFHLRGEESNRDERFVTALCQELNVPLSVEHFDVPAAMSECGVSMEMACRDLRYRWFRQLIADNGCGCVAVAHHSDDNIETFFLNVLRGTGIAGLAGIKPRNGDVVRPLLCVSRAEILAWLNGLNQDFVTDSTNLENDALRNRLRNVVLPALYDQFHNAKSALLTTISNASRCNDLYTEALGVMRNIVSDREDDRLVIDLEILASFDNRVMLLYEILKPLGFNHDQCNFMLTSAVGRHIESSTHTALIGRSTIDVAPHAKRDNGIHAINLEEDSVEVPIALEIKHISGNPFTPAMVNGKDTIALSNDALNCSQVVLRHWREGDRFKPFGMRGSKLVSDLFTDLKLDEKEKNETWILEADGEILWIVGYRASQLYKVSPHSTEFLILTIA